MKKLCFLLLVLMISISCVAHSESNQNENIFTRPYMTSSGLDAQGIDSVQLVDWIGDTCYAYLGDMSVYTYHSGERLEKYSQLPESPQEFDRSSIILDQKARDQLQETVTYIVAGNDGLYGYNAINGKFGRIDQAGIHWNDIRLDMDCINPNDELFPNRVIRSLLTEKRMYTLVFDGSNHNQFFGFDLLTGKSIEYKVDGAVNVCHAQSEDFLFLRRLEEGYRLSRLNTDTQTLSDLPLSMDAFPVNATVGGLAYDPDGDVICLAMKGQVYRSAAGGDFEPIAYVPTETLMTETPAWILPDGRYALCSMTGLYIRTQAQTLDHRQLVVHADAWTPIADENFCRRYPDIELNRIYEPITAEEAAQMLITQDDHVDVFEICADYTYASLVEKGLAGDLSVSEVLQYEAAAMLPEIAAVIKDEQGKLIAYPAEFRMWSCGIHEGYWRMIFGDRSLPANMDELMDAWIVWESEYKDEYPDIEFVFGFDYAQYCQKMITFFVQQYDSPGRQPDLGDPKLRNIINKLRQVYEIRTQRGRSTSDTRMATEGIASIVRFRAWDEVMYEPSKTVAVTSDNTLYNLYMGDYTKVQLTFAAGDTPRMDGTLYVYVVNPYSKDQDAALAYIECISELESAPYLYYAIHADYSEPYEWPDFHAWVESAIREKQQLKETKKALEGMEAPELSDIQAMIDYYELFLKNKESERWMISADTIAEHRKLLERLDLHVNSIYLGAPGSTAEQLIAQFSAVP